MLRPTLLILAALGLILLLKGLRGRRVGSAPHCRCGYCLEGLPELKACPECAAAIWDPSNTRRGMLKRSPRLAWTGAVLLALGASAWLSLRLAAPPGTNPYSWQPTPLLTLQSPDNGTNGQWFAREINDRLEAGTLSPSQRSALAARARSRLHAQRWQHDAPGYRSASAWAAIYVALWRSGTVTDEQLLDMLARSFTCRASAGQYTSPGSATQQATIHHVVQFAVRGPIRAMTPSRPTSHGVALNGEFASVDSGSSMFANATGDLDGGQGHNLTLAQWLLTQTEGCEIQVCFALDQASVVGAPPPPPPPHAFWIITLDVPPINPATGLPSGDVTLSHSLADEDPVAAAQSLMQDVALRVASGAFSAAERAELACRARAAIGQERFVPGDRKYGHVLGWGRIYAALWRSGDVTDQQMLAFLAQTMSCVPTDAVGWTRNPADPAGGATDLRELGLAICGPYRSISGDDSGEGALVNGEFAGIGTMPNVQQGAIGDFEGGPQHRLTLYLDAAAERSSHRIELSLPVRQPPSGASAFWILTLHVPTIDPSTGLFQGEIEVQHRFSATDPVGDAATAYRARRNLEIRERLRAQHETPRRQSQPDGKSPR